MFPEWTYVKTMDVRGWGARTQTMQLINRTIKILEADITMNTAVIWSVTYLKK